MPSPTPVPATPRLVEGFPDGLLVVALAVAVLVATGIWLLTRSR